MLLVFSSLVFCLKPSPKAWLLSQAFPEGLVIVSSRPRRPGYISFLPVAILAQASVRFCLLLSAVLLDRSMALAFGATIFRSYEAPLPSGAFFVAPTQGEEQEPIYLEVCMEDVLWANGEPKFAVLTTASYGIVRARVQLQSTGIPHPSGLRMAGVNGAPATTRDSPSCFVASAVGPADAAAAQP